MKKIGEYFRIARMEKGLSLEEVEQKTKIKKEFIKLIEKENWKSLPNYPILFGFINNLASFYDLDEKRAIALFKRDYLPVDESPAPKVVPKDKVGWSPKHTFIVGVSIVILLVGGYLLLQYRQFVSPPPLEIIEPTENQIVSDSWILVRGRTSSEATVVANDQPLLVNEEGVFEETIGVAENASEISIVARSRSGKETVVKRRIVTRP